MGRVPCCEKNGLKKGPWTPEEDQKLIDYIQKHGYGNWRTLPKNAGLQRCGKSCRLRWTNYLRPDIKRGRFTLEEEESIIQLHSILGNKWSTIASHLPGRTDNEIKNYWNTHIRKKLLSMGIDPVTHSPRLDLLYISSILNSSLYANSSNFNIQRLLTMQPIENTELLKLASSLLFSQQCEDQNLCAQNDQYNPQILNQIQFQNPVQQVACTELVEPNMSSFTDLSSQQHSLLNDWHRNNGTSLSTFSEDYIPQLLSSYSYSNYNSDNQNLMDPPLSETTTLNSNNSSNKNFSFASVLSTPSSSPIELNSSSTFINGSITEDERESYGSSSNMLKFEIPEILDVNEFM
ncbi:hypothetical protein TanjilG_09042 [Lupinus angustifolius]|uniref:Uncharacterized protein n=2 Tax=Lupinus angustifolius TaxID=3871 RepID=A0A4P1QPG0_LUPAN|nr:hypothetical protein TanjilG_09042 [Lupinus angustifolius]